MEIFSNEYNPFVFGFDIIMLPPADANRAFQAVAKFRKLTFSVTHPKSVADTLEPMGDAPIFSTMLTALAADRSSARPYCYPYRRPSSALLFDVLVSYER